MLFASTELASVVKMLIGEGFSGTLNVIQSYMLAKECVKRISEMKCHGNALVNYRNMAINLKSTDPIMTSHTEFAKILLTCVCFNFGRNRKRP